METLSDSFVIIFGTFILHQLIFWIYNGIILLLTYVIYPEHSKKYKIQKVRTFLHKIHRSLLFIRIFTSIPNPSKNVQKPY